MVGRQAPERGFSSFRTRAVPPDSCCGALSDAVDDVCARNSMLEMLGGTVRTRMIGNLAPGPQFLSSMAWIRLRGLGSTEQVGYYGGALVAEQTGTLCSRPRRKTFFLEMKNG